MRNIFLAYGFNLSIKISFKCHILSSFVFAHTPEFIDTVYPNSGGHYHQNNVAYHKSKSVKG